MEAETQAAEARTAEAPKKKVVKKAAKKAAKKSAPVKKAAKKAAAGEKSEANFRETVTVKSFKALMKNGAMTASQTQEAIKCSYGIKLTLDALVERQLLRLVNGEETGATTYETTAAGRKALETGMLNPPRGSSSIRGLMERRKVGVGKKAKK